MAEPTWRESLERSEQARRERLLRAEAKYRERIGRAERAPARPARPFPLDGWVQATMSFDRLVSTVTAATTSINQISDQFNSNWGGTTGTMGTVNVNANDAWLHWNNQQELMRTVAQTITYPDVTTNIPHTSWEAREPTERELWTANQRRLIQRVRTGSFEVRRRVAQRAARRLLLEHLREDQRREFEEHGWFHVETADGTRRYRIMTGTAGNVLRLGDDGNPVTRYCIHPAGVPAYDTMLGQALMLENDEEEFLRVANATPMWR